MFVLVNHILPVLLHPLVAAAIIIGIRDHVHVGQITVALPQRWAVEPMDIGILHRVRARSRLLL